MPEGWQEATLAEKIPDVVLKNGPRPVWKILADEARGLKLDWEISALQEWLQVKARGEDCEVFLNLLKKKYGEAPVQRSNAERWDVRKGFVTGAGRIGFGVYIDIGVLEPSRKDALYPLHRMRAQISDGAVKSSREILLDNGLADYFPVKVVVTELQGENITVELADETRDMLLEWKREYFDRVIVAGADREYVERLIESMNLGLDVIKVETLSLLVQCLLCKLSTDSPGVVARIGSRLRGVGLTAFRTPAKQVAA